MDKFSMTPQQLQILDFLKAHFKKHRVMPTVREITTSLGFTSPAGTLEKLNGLEKKGYIERKKNEARAIRIL